eukprot:TRINITY_DN9784_c5_g1_i1.p1 TRINITY_DN9784_c5_g1~~TRINITY_DN9784_c5_g1_i1.p1  ORF type:complete len:831 (+),score=187.42 TRINITY_DN9784_c5_g1_i1:48-2540(+)
MPPAQRLWGQEDRDYLHSVDAARIIDRLVSRLVVEKPPKEAVQQFLAQELGEPDTAFLPLRAEPSETSEPKEQQPATPQPPPGLDGGAGHEPAPPKRRGTLREMHCTQRRPRSVVIDTDCGPPEYGGGEEIIALVWFASAVHQEELELAAVTTCGGLVPPEITFRVARQTLLAAGLTHVPIGVERRVPAAGGTHWTGDSFIPPHARPGAACKLPVCDLDPESAPSSTDLLVSCLRDRPHQLTVVCFGSLTNLIAAEQSSPGVLRLAREVICMGGFGDIEAATNRVAYIPREVAGSLTVAEVYRERIAAFAKPGEDIERSYLHTLVKGLCDAIEMQNRLPLRQQPNRITAAATAVLYPQLFTFRRRPVDIMSAAREREISSGHLLWSADSLLYSSARSAFVEDVQTLIETLPDDIPEAPFSTPPMPAPRSFVSDSAIPTPYPDPRPLLIDTDPGGDDVFALLWLAAGMKRELVDIVAVTTGEGNVTARQTFAAARRVLLAVGLGDVTVARGVEANRGAQDDFHGSDGLGGLGDQLPPLDVRFEDAPAAPDVIVSSLTAHPHELTVVCFGPLSNLAAADAAHPGVLRLAREVVCMGGAYEVPGNITATAEFNVLHNPESFKRVLEACDLVVLPLDVTTKLVLEQHMMDRIDAALSEDTTGTPTRTPRQGGGGQGLVPKAPSGRRLNGPSRRYSIATQQQQPSTPQRCSGRQVFTFLQSLFEFQVMQTLNFKQTTPTGVTGMMVHDGACSLYLLHPELFTFIRCHTLVETSGTHSRGRTLYDHRLRFGPQPNSWVAIDVDADKALEAFVEDLRAFFKSLNIDLVSRNGSSMPG